MNILINICIYQIVWLLCVFLGNEGATISVLLVALHLARSGSRKKDMLLMAGLLGTGILIDGAIHFSGVMTYPGTAMPIPFWLGMIWVALGVLPHHSLNWLKGKHFLAAVLGGIGGPLAYWAGVRAGAAVFVWPTVPSLILFSLIWSCLFPVIMFFADRSLPSAMDCRQ